MTERDLIMRLGRLNDLKAEVNELSQRIARIEMSARGEHWGRISLERAAQVAQDVGALLDKMEARRADCMEELGRLYGIIDAAPDSQVRRILAARYIDGMIWKEVAFRIGETDEQVPRRIHNRYVKQLAEEMTWSEG